MTIGLMATVSGGNAGFEYCFTPENNYFDLHCVFLGLLDLFWGREGVGGGGGTLHIYLNLS